MLVQSLLAVGFGLAIVLWISLLGFYRLFDRYRDTGNRGYVYLAGLCIAFLNANAFLRMTDTPSKVVSIESIIVGAIFGIFALMISWRFGLKD